MPNDFLRLRGVIIHVDIVFADANTCKPGNQTRIHNLEAVCAGAAPNINGASYGVRSGARPSFGLFPLLGAVCRIRHKRDISQSAGCIQFIYCVLLHILQ